MGIIDTGSNIIAGPTTAIKMISKIVGAKADCSNLNKLPPMNLKLGSGFQVNLTPTSYMMKIKLPAWAHPFHKIPLHHSAVSAMRARRRPRGIISSLKRRSGVQASKLKLRLQHIGRGFWHKIVRRLSRRHGIDFGPTLLQRLPPLSSFTSSTLCMPALVPLNAQTKQGALWVLGKPLYDLYYTRWSWPIGEPSPSIYVKEISKAAVCQADAANPSTGGASGSGSSLESMEMPDRGILPSSPSLMRREDPGTDRMPLPAASKQVRSGSTKEVTDLTRHEIGSAPKRGVSELASDMLVEQEFGDIMYPHWAKNLEEV